MNPRNSSPPKAKPRKSLPWWIAPLVISALIVALTGSLFLFAPKPAPVDHTSHRIEQADKKAAVHQENAATSDSLRKHIAGELDIANGRIRQLVEQLDAARSQAQYAASRVRDTTEALECELCVMHELHSDEVAALTTRCELLSKELARLEISDRVGGDLRPSGNPEQVDGGENE
jgi:hypothetical protein